MSKTVFGQQGYHALTFALARLSCFRFCFSLYYFFVLVLLLVFQLLCSFCFVSKYFFVSVFVL